MDRPAALRLALACTGLVLLAAAARAEEPLFLRIRPLGTPQEIGAAGASQHEADALAQARAAREAVWERSTRRANIAIASVCRGCLQPSAVVQKAMGFAPPAPSGREEGPALPEPPAEAAPAIPSGPPPSLAASLAPSLAQP